MTAAERQRRRRLKIAGDPQLHDETRAKERARWHQRVANKKVKLIGDLSERGQRSQRKKWREQWFNRSRLSQRPELFILFHFRFTRPWASSYLEPSSTHSNTHKGTLSTCHHSSFPERWPYNTISKPK